MGDSVGRDVQHFGQSLIGGSADPSVALPRAASVPFPGGWRFGRRLTARPPTLVGVSDAAHDHDDAPRGASRLPSDLTDDQLATAPVLASIDILVIEELSEIEDDAFAAAIGS